MSTLLQILLSTLLVSLFSFVGILLISLRMDINKLTFYLISLASGALIGGAFLHLIPETLQGNPHTGLFWIAIGVFFFFILEKLLIWRHCHHHHEPTDHARPVTARMVLIGDTIHNFIDGVIIATGFMTSPSLGISVTVAIIFHEIPQELGDFGILVHGGFKPMQALFMNALTATSAIAGGLMTYFFFGASTTVHAMVMPLAAGGFLYIALADLIPQLHVQTNIRQTVSQIILLIVGFSIITFLKKIGV
jgi:zinc and cadmium transporter